MAEASASAWDISSLASQIFSLTSTNVRLNSRNRLNSDICRFVLSTASGEDIILVIVLPLTSRVRDQLGPWPGELSLAQWQLPLPHFRNRGVSEPGRISPIPVISALISFRRLVRSSRSIWPAMGIASSDSVLRCQINAKNRSCQARLTILSCTRGEPRA